MQRHNLSTYHIANTLHSPKWMNCLVLSASCSGHLLLSAWLCYTQTLWTTCQVWASIIPAPWWVIKHVCICISASPIHPGLCLHSQLLGLICHLHLFFINLSPLWSKETARMSAPSTSPQGFEHYQKGRFENNTIINCKWSAHVLLLFF